MRLRSFVFCCGTGCKYLVLVLLGVWFVEFRLGLVGFLLHLVSVASVSLPGRTAASVPLLCDSGAQGAPSAARLPFAMPVVTVDCWPPMGFADAEFRTRSLDCVLQQASRGPSSCSALLAWRRPGKTIPGFVFARFLRRVGVAWQEGGGPWRRSRLLPVSPLSHCAHSKTRRFALMTSVVQGDLMRIGRERQTTCCLRTTG